MAQQMPGPGQPTMGTPGGFQNLEITFGPLDTKTDPALLPHGALTRAENASTQTNGIYIKRFGYTAIGTTNGPTACRRLLTRGGELTVLQYPTIWRYASALVPAGATPWVSTNQEFSQVDVSMATVASDMTTDYLQTSIAGNSTLVVHAWLDTLGKLRYLVQSVADNAQLVAPTQLGGGTTWDQLRTATVGNYAVIVYASTTAQLIKVVTVHLTDGTASAETTLASGVNVNAARALIDTYAIDSATMLLAWSSNTPNVRAEILNIPALTIATGPSVMAAETADTDLACIFTTGEFGVIAYHSTAAGGLRGLTFNSSLTVTHGPLNIEAVVAPVSGRVGIIRTDVNVAMVLWDREPAAGLKGYTQWRTIDSTGALGTLPTAMWNVSLVSKPFLSNGDVYANVIYSSTNNVQSTFFAMKFIAGAESNVCHAMQAYRSALTKAGSSYYNALSDVISPAGNKVRWNGNRGIKFLSTASPRSTIATFSLDWTNRSQPLFAEIGGDTLIGGGIGTKYDGLYITEQNFPLYPEIISATQGGGGGIADGTYNYIAIYETTDQNANADRSTTSVPKAITVAGGAGVASVAVKIEQLAISRTSISGAGAHQGAIVTLFRTTASGTNYFFVGSGILSDVTQTITLTDTLPDATIISQRQLYTTGGVLDREPPTAIKQQVLHNGRIYYISAEDPKVIGYSGDFIPGEAPWFSTVQQFRVDIGGACTALGSLDDKLIVFKSDRMFKVYGKGLNALGQNNDLTPPALISADVGCIDPRSVVITPDGLMFLTAKGIYLLTRSEQLVYVGAAVQTYTDSFPTCRAAVMLPDRREIRFLMVNAAGTGALFLVYNYDAKMWTTHLIYNNLVPADAVNVPGIGFFWASNGGALYQENTTFLDPSSTFFSMVLETGWIKPAGVQGFARCQRANFLGQHQTDHALLLQVAHDYNDTYTETTTWNAVTLAALSQEQVSYHLHQQKGESFRFKILDNPDGSSPAEGYRARGLLLKVRAIRSGTFEKLMVAGAKT